MSATTVNEGDIFVCSWGYDQTNVDFYEVVELTPSGKSVRLQMIDQEVVESNGPSERVRAVPGTGSGDVFTKRLRSYEFRGNTEHSVTLTSYSSAYRMSDPAATKHQTGWGFGH